MRALRGSSARGAHVTKRSAGKILIESERKSKKKREIMRRFTLFIISGIHAYYGYG